MPRRIPDYPELMLDSTYSELWFFHYFSFNHYIFCDGGGAAKNNWIFYLIYKILALYYFFKSFLLSSYKNVILGSLYLRSGSGLYILVTLVLATPFFIYDLCQPHELDPLNRYGDLKIVEEPVRPLTKEEVDRLEIAAFIFLISLHLMNAYVFNEIPPVEYTPEFLAIIEQLAEAAPGP
jgi:hypothetical protein